MALNISHAHELIELNHQKNISNAHPQLLYGPRDYIMGQSGKRLRSILCLMGYELYQEDISAACPLAYAIELFHNFTLVHDDIMDEATLRRGLPTVSSSYGIPAAILSGDVMLIEVYDRLLKIESPVATDMLVFVTQTARQVCEGQSMDMAFEQMSEVSLSDYLQMIELKTAVLLGASIKLGAMLGGASTKDHEHLYKFGVNAGISFQLQDDYLDVYGEQERLGKIVGGDIIQGKKTYLYLKTVELLPAGDKEDFQRLYSDVDIEASAKVTRVTNIFDELYLSHYCMEAKKAFFDLAQSHLTLVDIDEKDRDALITFASTLMDRPL